MENEIMLRIADILFFVFHIALIIFNLFGWIPKQLRKWNLITLGLTAFSWFVLGIFYGFGYCFLTDWHWSIRRELDLPVESNSYIHFLWTHLTGIPVSEKLVEILTAVLFFSALAMSVLTNFSSRRRKQVPR